MKKEHTRQVFIEVSPEFLAALPSTVKVPVSNGWLTREAKLLVDLGMLDKEAWENAMKGKKSEPAVKVEPAVTTANPATPANSMNEPKEEKAAFRVVTPDFDDDENSADD